MMTSASVLVLAAIAPAAHAQQTEVGAPGQALTAGTVTTLTGTISDGGANSGVGVYGADGDIVTLTGAVIDSRATANLTSFTANLQNGATNPLIVNILTGSSIQSAQTAVSLYGQAFDVTVDTTAGGSTFAAGGNGSALSVMSNAANVSLLNGANAITANSIGLSASANGATGNVILNSTGGTIVAGGYGVSTQSNGGTITIGQGAGVTSAISLTQNTGIGVSAFSNGATPGAINITTGGGGTINGGMIGINAFSNGAGAVNVNVGDVIGGTAAPTSRGVNATSMGGNVAVNATAAIAGGQNGIYASTTGAGTITVDTNAVTATSFDAVYLSGQTGAVDYTLNGANTVRGGTGVTANATSGAIAIRALNTGSAIIGNTRAVDARTSAGGSIDITLAGATTGGVVGIVAGGDGSVTVNTAAVNAPNDRAINATTTTGAINVATSGAISGAQGGIYAVSAGAGATTISATGPVNGGGLSGIDSRNVGLGSASVGAANQRVGTVTGGSNGIFVASGGDISIYAGTVTGTSGRGVLASNQTSNGNFQVNGAVLIDVTGTVTAGNGQGVTIVNNGALATNTNTIRAADVRSTGGSAIYSFSNGGATSITAGNITAAYGNNNGWTGVYAVANNGGNIGVSTGAINASFRGVDIENDGVGAGGLITINTGAISGFQGVRAVSVGSAGVNIGQTNRIGAITTTGGAGVFATGAGDVNISTTTVAATGGSAEVISTTANSPSITNASADVGFGVFGASTGGAVNINASGLTSAVTADAIAAQTTAANGNITINAAGATSTNARGIAAVAQGGNISINAAGPIQAGSFGIQAATSGAGAISVLASGPVTSANANGIAAVTTGLGAVTVGSATNRIGAVTANGASGTGITAFGAGDVSVYASSVSGGTRGIVAANQYTNPNGRVLIDVTGPIVGLNSWGIIGVNNGTLAANSLTINTGDVTGTGRTAISAQTVGGDINITTTGAILSRASQTLTSNSAVFAESDTNGRITINTLGTVNGYDGIYALSDGATGAINIASAAAVTGTNQYGIYGHTNGGNILIDARGPVSGAIGGVVGTVSGAGAVDIRTAGVTASNGPAVDARASTGAVSVSSTGAIRSQTVGINAVTTSGAITVNTTAGGTIAPGAQVGIQAVTQTGAITINQAGSIGSSGAGNTVGNGIYASIGSGAGALTINSSGGIFVSAGTGLQSAGIYAVNGGTGATNVVSTGVIDPGAYGVVVQGAGPVSYAANGGLVEGGQGVYVASTGAGPVTVTSTAGTTITGLSGIGLQAVSVGGPVVVTTGGAVSGATSGIVASTTGSGSTAVTNTGAVTSGSGPAIDASSGTGGLNLNIRGNVISASGPAILATSTGGGTINVASGAVVAGRVNSATDAVIQLNTASGTSSTINVAQGASVQAVSGSPFTTAIRATGGSVVVNNAGTISGQVDFSALTGANSGQLTGGAGTTFQTGGLSVFGAGNDTFTNAGQLVTVGTSTTFDFRGGTNVFNNNGQVLVGFSPVSAGGSTFLLSSLTTFNNAGALNLMNGVLGDSITAPGANYVGSTGARLLIDTAIVPGGRSDVLTVGTTSGVTSVAIRDTASTSFGAYNPTGIVIVNGATHAGDFILDSNSSFYNAGIFGGAIDKPGLFFSQLGVNGAGQTVLVSLPKVQAYQFSTLASQAQAVWYETAPRAARQAEVRDQLAQGDRAGGFWADVQGTHTARDVDRDAATLAGLRSYDASYGQDIAAATIGYDAVRPMMNGDVVFGASAGYVNSSADFDKQSTSVDMDGVSGSAYASFVRSGWFVAGTVGATQLNAEIKAPRLAGFTHQETDITSVGATLEAGFRAPFVMGATIEPTAALAYVNSSVDDFVAAGSTFRFEDGESLRPSIGARVSGDTGFSAGWATRYNVSVRAVGEVLSENAVVVGSAGPDLRVVDQFENAYGEVKAGLTSQSVNGLSVFGDLTGRYSDEVRAVGASIGLRLRY